MLNHTKNSFNIYNQRINPIDLYLLANELTNIKLRIIVYGSKINNNRQLTSHILNEKNKTYIY